MACCDTATCLCRCGFHLTFNGSRSLARFLSFSLALVLSFSRSRSLLRFDKNVRFIINCDFSEHKRPKKKKHFVTNYEKLS